MKIFEITWVGLNEKSWVSSNTLIGALQTYCSVTGMDLCEFDGDEEIVELPREKWAEYNTTDEDGKFLQTFEQWMVDNKDNDVIAETSHAHNEQED